MEDSVYNIKKKNQKYKFNLDDNNYAFGENISNLEREKQSLQTTLKLTTEIESNSITVNNELSNQLLSMGSIGDKVNKIFHLMSGSYKDTTWIKQRGKNDKCICLSLGFLTILIIGFTYFYIRPKLRGKWDYVYKNVFKWWILIIKNIILKYIYIYKYLCIINIYNYKYI